MSCEGSGEDCLEYESEFLFSSALDFSVIVRPPNVLQCNTEFSYNVHLL